jgi:hypothetical protein
MISFITARKIRLRVSMEVASSFEPKRFIRERQQHRALIVVNSPRLIAAQAPHLIFEPRDCRETIIPSVFELDQELIRVNGCIAGAHASPHSGPAPGRTRFAATVPMAWLRSAINAASSASA